MLDIKKTQEGSKLEFSLDGRLDTITAPQLEEEVKALTPLKQTLKDDLKELEETMKKYNFRPASVK